ncbi:MAG TPA: acyl-CoA dehydrogenase family protein [Planctomycetota bacterium]
MEPDAFAERLEAVAAVAREHAGAVDAEARFPSETVAALRAQGLLGLISASAVGGGGASFRPAFEVVERLGRECGSSAMVLCMHYCAVAVLEAHGTEAVRASVAAGKTLVTLAFSESGSRSHFWAPLSSARAERDSVVLDAEKSWVTSASNADGYVWSSRPLAAQGESTLWLVPRTAAGLSRPARFDGLGLRGNDSLPVRAQGVRVRPEDRLGPDGGGFALMMGVVLPWFSVLNAACSLGLMESMTARTTAHVASTRFAHLDSSLAQLPTVRAYLARMRITTDMTRALLHDTLEALAGQRADVSLRVLEAKAAAGEGANQVGDLAMRVCGGAAFRRDVAVERPFRDARAATVMAPTTDALYDFIGKALTGLSLF